MLQHQTQNHDGIIKGNRTNLGCREQEGGLDGGECIVFGKQNTHSYNRCMLAVRVCQQVKSLLCERGNVCLKIQMSDILVSNLFFHY